MTFLNTWRILGSLGCLFYAYLAFHAAQDLDKFSTGLYCFVAALYLFGAAKAHSR